MNEMSFLTAIKTCFRKYCVFKGRARRAEYWYFVLFMFIVEILVSALSGVVALPGLLKGAEPAALSKPIIVVSVIALVIELGCFLPSLGVTTRRLHDGGHSGWWLLVCYALLIVSCILAGLAIGMSAALQSEALLKGFMVAGLALMIPCFPLAIVMLVWLIKKGTKGPNRYGSDPLHSVDDDAVEVTLGEATRQAAEWETKSSGTWKNTFSLLLGAVLLTSLSSCEGIDGTIVGSWKVTHAEVYGTDMPVAEGDIYTFRMNGTYTIKSDGKVTSQGDWEYAESLLSLFSNSEWGIGGNYEVVALTSDEMVLEFDFGFVYGAMELVKTSKSESRD